MLNTWPDGIKRALHQHEHGRWNASNHPGTQQICVICDCATERCEEDSIHTEDGEGPFCNECCSSHPENEDRTDAE